MSANRNSHTSGFVTTWEQLYPGGSEHVFGISSLHSVSQTLSIVVKHNSINHELFLSVSAKNVNFTQYLHFWCFA